jgi:hypothetical protein
VGGEGGNSPGQAARGVGPVVLLGKELPGVGGEGGYSPGQAARGVGPVVLLVEDLPGVGGEGGYSPGQAARGVGPVVLHLFHLIQGHLANLNHNLVHFIDLYS